MANPAIRAQCGAARGAGVVPLGFNGRGLTEAGAARILESLDELETLLP